MIRIKAMWEEKKKICNVRTPKMELLTRKCGEREGKEGEEGEKCLFRYFLQFPSRVTPHYVDCQLDAWGLGVIVSIAHCLLGKLCTRG